MRVLLVEDERMLSDAVSQFLRQQHCLVDTSPTGPEGLDGLSILKRLRVEGISTPVMMLTARSGLEDRINGLEAGADYYLPKPFHMEELLACLHTITRRREAEPSAALTRESWPAIPPDNRSSWDRRNLHCWNCCSETWGRFCPAKR